MYDKIESLLLGSGVLFAVVVGVELLAEYFPHLPSWLFFVAGIAAAPVLGFIILLKEPWPFYKPVRAVLWALGVFVETNDERHQLALLRRESSERQAAEFEKDGEPGDWRPGP